MTFTNSEIEQKLQAALERLAKHDGFLLENVAHERSVAHKLAEYLQDEFGDARHVDCEYDLHGMLLKELDGIRECADDRRSDRIYPDIIVHRRNTDDANTLVVEMKVRHQPVDCDLMKLSLMTGSDQYRYQAGVLIQFHGTVEPKLTWFWRPGTQREAERADVRE